MVIHFMITESSASNKVTTATFLFSAMTIGSHQRAAALRHRSSESEAIYLLPRSSTSTTLREDNSTPTYINDSIDMQPETECVLVRNNKGGQLHDSVVVERSMTIGAKVR